MITITPRIFVLPIIALAVILSLPRPAQDNCARESTELATAGTAATDACTTGARPRLVQAPAPTLVR